MRIFIWGNKTSDNFTPRPGKDTIGQPGRPAGLSASNIVPSGRKAQCIETDNFRPPLSALPDDPLLGGTSGHFAIAPVDEHGNVDQTQLEAWGQSRGTGQTHEFTQILLDAVVEPDVKGD